MQTQFSGIFDCFQCDIRSDIKIIRAVEENSKIESNQNHDFSFHVKWKLIV